MKRVVFLVEGDTEVILINNHVIPFLYQKGFTNPMNVQKILTNRKLHKKGGNSAYSYLKNDIQRITAQGNVIVTTFLDFFRLPTDFPGFVDDASKIGHIEQAVKAELSQFGEVMPYIQKYELEALMFSSMDGFNFVVQDKKTLAELELIVNSIAPEEINGGRHTAPSKRLEALFPYEKTVDGELILEMIGIEKMREKCPRFKEWIDSLICLLENTRN